MIKKILLAVFVVFPIFSSAQQMWINEIHYDNTGGDVGEFVEVVVENTFVGNLSNLEIIFYNGSNGSIISQSEPRTLDTFDAGQNSGGFTIYSRLFPSPPGIQNGNPDGIALVNNVTVVDFISYEGTLTATAGPANGMTSVDIGVAEPGAIGQSLQLSGKGNIRQLFTWQAPASETRGVRNINQTFADVAPRVVSIFPLNGTSGVNFNTPVKIEFSEPVNVMNPASVSIICGANGQNYTVTQDGDNSHYVVTPGSNWSVSETCNVIILASKVTAVDNGNQLDGDGNGISGDNFLFSFTVASDPLPTVTSVNPADGSVLIPQSFSVDINFSENVNLSNNAINLNCPNAIPYTSPTLSNINTVTITTNAPVAQGAFCTVTLNATNILDTDGPDLSQLDGDGDGVAGGNFSFGFAIIEPIYEIYEIQGSASASPLDGSFVRTQGNVVTALTDNGFFMQTPEPGDSDPNTSDGIFVFSTFAVAEGDIVDVRGRATEFSKLTEIDMVSSVSVTGSGAPLPTPIPFDGSTPSTDPANLTCVNNFECFEGMLVSVANGMANTGTGIFGEFMATATGVRPMRGPGVEYSQTGDNQLPYDLLDTMADRSSYDPDIFDENPEIFEVDTNGILNMPIVQLNGGSTFSASGPLNQFNNYSLSPKQFSFTPRVFDPIRAPIATEIIVATQNMARFFDATDDPNINDFVEGTTTPAEFDGRVAQASLYFRTIMLSPDIIVLEEVENLVAVQAIADKMNSDDPSNTYSAYLVEGNDIGGIDVGMLSKDTVSNVVITQLGKAEVLQFGNTGRPLHDRPPLLLNATVTKGGTSREINVLGVHTRSRSGITGSQRQRIRNKHLEQALSIANMVQNLQSPLIPLIVTGDFNDFEFSDGYADVVGEIKGVVDPLKNLFSSNGNSVVNPPLVNVVDNLPATQRYSFVFRGTIQTLDHALLNGVANTLLTETQFVRGNIDAPNIFVGDYTQTLAMSDHDGLILYLDLSLVIETIFLDGFE